MFPSFVAHKLIHPCREYFTGWHKAVRKNVEDLNKTQYWTRKELENIQLKKFEKLLKSSMNVNFYKNYLTSGNLKDISLPDLPIMSKSMIRENKINLINSKFNENELIKVSTGGSTGEPLQILISEKSAIFGTAIKKRNLIWTGFREGDNHFKLWGAPTDIDAVSKTVKQRAFNYIYNKTFINAFNMTDTIFHNLYVRLKYDKAGLMESYAEILFQFAKYLEKNDLKPLKLPAVISSAGTLNNHQRKVIEKYFGGNIYNRYGCREVGDIAHECEMHSGMHINMERFILEINNPNRDGVGEILVTDLESHAFPIIRYKIGDLGSFSEEKCDCGRGLLLLKQVHGRTLDMIATPDGKKISGVLFPHIFKDYENILVGQVVQEELNSIKIHLQLVNQNDQDFVPHLRNKLSEIISADLSIAINIVDKIAVTSSGKYRVVISKFAEELNH